ncbi:P-loop containing nucleoside triphosphate hydrolase protein [Zopfochytrium polystomum]|nr:P-loop containing nucleoside triphosphate hydrolase protein [Zopfochytrium polystomum]
MAAISTVISMVCAWLWLWRRRGTVGLVAAPIATTYLLATSYCNVCRAPSTDSDGSRRRRRWVHSLQGEWWVKASGSSPPYLSSRLNRNVCYSDRFQCTEAADAVVPSWVRDSFTKAREAIEGFDLSGVEVPDISKMTGIDFSSIKLPTFPPFGGEDGDGTVASPPKLPGMEQAAKSFNEMTSTAQSATSPNAKPMPPPDHELMILTKKLIEVRNLLKTVNVQNANLKLPSIVVVGSQSSGKSSVLEAIVGHEFLPKGNNMVTRRPIELTLIHTPNSMEEFSEFPQLGLGKIKDFEKVQKTLTDLNLAVPEAECVSSSPIELRIHSPNVPDLTMVDLPGYIQIHNKNQPAVLKEKIADLCESYIKDTNIILAVCAADVDLANSEALRASRKVDPAGVRTIGVITKMDLVEPERAIGILQNSDYPLKLGYVGVICKARSPSTAQAIVRAEDSYFKSHSQFSSAQVTVGTPTLRKRLMEVLEDHMGRGLYRVVDAVQSELDEARYQFKVQYDDRRLSAESYVAEVMDGLKTRLRQFAREYGKQQVRDQVRGMLEHRLLELCRDVYWSDSGQLEGLFSKTCLDASWQTRADMSSSQLAKSGVGRSSVQLVVDTLLDTMELICTEDFSKYHASTRDKLMEFSNDVIRAKFNSTVDQVENTIRPFKLEVDCTEAEWQDGRKRAIALLERSVADARKELQSIKASLGRRKHRSILKQVRLAQRQHMLELQANGAEQFPRGDTHLLWALTPPEGMDPKLFEAGVRTLELTSQAAILQRRVTALKSSRTCSTVATGKACCPEVFLSAVAEKLTHHAVLFIYVELVNEFFFQIPRDVDNKLYYELDRWQIRQFAMENPAVARHLETQERKETLELVMQKLRALSQ